MRKEGYYWVKHRECDDWEVTYFNGTVWFPMGVPSHVNDKFFFQIHEEQLQEPKPAPANRDK